MAIREGSALPKTYLTLQINRLALAGGLFLWAYAPGVCV